MRGSNRLRHHDQTGLSGAARLATIAVLAAVALVPEAATAAGQDPVGRTIRVHLPTRLDGLAVAVGSESILNGPRGIETRLPGPVADDEMVRVRMGMDGRPVGVTVDQRLRLSGLGDFQFKVPGPAKDVEGLPGTEDPPGLRKGAILWQGFSPGRKALAARARLHPALEAARLPLAVRLSVTVGGRALRPGVRSSGPLSLRLRIGNASALPVTLRQARGDAHALAPVLDALRDGLRRGREPVPGSDGIPTVVPATSAGGTVSRPIEAPILVGGSVGFPRGSVDGVEARGGDLNASGSIVRFSAMLGGGRPLATAVTVSATAHRLGVPRISFRAHTVLPLGGVAAPPGGGSWRRLVHRHPDAASGGRMLAVLTETMWAVARRAPFDAYLGNPDPAGPSRTGYSYVLAPESIESGAPLVATETGVTPLRALAFSALAIAVVVLLGWAWSRS